MKPTIGRIVLTIASNESFPAIITKVHHCEDNAIQLVDIAIFTSDGIEFRKNIEFLDGIIGENACSFPPRINEEKKEEKKDNESTINLLDKLGKTSEQPKPVA